MFPRFRLSSDQLRTKLHIGPASEPRLFQVRDRLHEGRTVSATGPEIANTVAKWLAELDVHSPLVDDLARAAQVGDWAAAKAIGERLSVEISFAS